MLASKDFTPAKKKLPPVGLNLIITGSRILCLESSAYPPELAWYVLVSLSHILLILDKSSKSKKVKWCMNKSQFKGPLIHARLAQVAGLKHLIHWSLGQALLEVTLSFAVVKSFDGNIAFLATLY